MCCRRSCGDGSTRKGKSLCVQTTLIHWAPHTPWFAATADISLHRLWAQVQFNESKNFQEEISQEVWGAVHSQYFLQYLQISFTTFWKLHICGLREWNLLAGGNPVQIHCMDQEDMKTYFLENVISGIEHQEQNFWRIGTQRTRSHGKRRSLRVILSKIHNSKSHSENIKDKQEMPSIRLWKNLQRFTKFWWSKNFKVFRIDTKGEWKNM